MASALSPFQLLEINLISAQDLSKVSRNMKTYAMAWVHPDRKLTTRVDANGGASPTWNDKFVFRVDDRFLRSDTSAVMIEIYAVHWLRDVHVGTVRVLVNNLIPPLPTRGAAAAANAGPRQLGMRFVALQVRRPSGRPQGILNVGVTVLDSTLRSMPLYTQLDTSALGYQQLMGTDPQHHNKSSQQSVAAATAPGGIGGNSFMGINKPSLRRVKSMSDGSSMVGIEEEPIIFDALPPPPPLFASKKGGGSELGGGSSLLGGRKGGSELGGGGSLLGGRRKGKAPVVYDKPLSVVEGASDLAVQLDVQKKAMRRQSSRASSRARRRARRAAGSTSVVSQSELGSHLGSQISANDNGNNINNHTTTNKAGSEIGSVTSPNSNNIKNKPKHYWLQPPSVPKPKGKQQQHNNTKESTSKPNNNNKRYPISKDFANGSVWTESEVGPSPSEVAYALAEDRKYRSNPIGRGPAGSSMLEEDDGGSEGLKSKLERWRNQLPSLYDYSGNSTPFGGSSPARHNGCRSRRGSYRYADRHNSRDNGKFSCFGNIAGYECTIVCGKGGEEITPRKKPNKRLNRAPSFESVSTYF